MSFGWFVKLISANTAAQDALRRTLQESFPGPGLPSSAEILDTKIPYLDAFVEEAVRVSAVAGIITRRATVDAEVLGHRIPAGANLVINTRFVHVRAQAAVPEALRSKSSRAAHARGRAPGGLDGVPGQDLHLFEPRRWLATDAAGGDVFDANSLPTLVFGGGLRGCFGETPISDVFFFPGLSWNVRSSFDHGSDSVGTFHRIHRQKACFAKLTNYVHPAHTLV